MICCAVVGHRLGDFLDRDLLSHSLFPAMSMEPWVTSDGVLNTKEQDDGWGPRGTTRKLTAVLDWEFALSASGVIDVGNALRFENESPAVEAERFSAAYREAGGILDDNWHAQAMFADLLAQLTFLVEQEERPRTFATALGVIDRYLGTIAA